MRRSGWESPWQEKFWHTDPLVRTNTGCCGDRWKQYQLFIIRWVRKPPVEPTSEDILDCCAEEPKRVPVQWKPMLWNITWKMRPKKNYAEKRTVLGVRMGLKWCHFQSSFPTTLYTRRHTPSTEFFSSSKKSADPELAFKKRTVMNR